MYSKTLPILLSCLLFSCQSNSGTASPRQTNQSAGPGVAVNPASILAIPLPQGFQRFSPATGSFGEWLQHVLLKKDNTVYLYNGAKKANQSAQFAVLDISTGDQNLQQCADAVMRLRAEYLFATKQFSKISFTDNEGKSYQFLPPYEKDHLMHYLQTVFGMCGSASLAKQLKPKPLTAMQIGDVLIRGGFPGHAVIVMDMAKNAAGEKIYLLAQSYMPAQDIHVLLNPNADAGSPWYPITNETTIVTPEYVFTNAELKTW